MRYPERVVVRLMLNAMISALHTLHGLLIRINMSLDAGPRRASQPHELYGQLLAVRNADDTRSCAFSWRSSGFEFIETINAVRSGGIRPSAITPDLLGRSCSL